MTLRSFKLKKKAEVLRQDAARHAEEEALRCAAKAEALRRADKDKRHAEEAEALLQADAETIHRAEEDERYMLKKTNVVPTKKKEQYIVLKKKNAV